MIINIYSVIAAIITHHEGSQPEAEPLTENRRREREREPGSLMMPWNQVVSLYLGLAKLLYILLYEIRNSG